MRADKRLGGCSLLKPANRVLLQVLLEIFALVDTNEMELTEVHILWGVNPARAVSLPGNVNLVTLREAPPSLVRDLYLGVPERRNETPGRASSSGPTTKSGPSSATAIRASFRRRFSGVGT